MICSNPVLNVEGNFFHMPGKCVFLVLCSISSGEGFLLHVNSVSLGLDPSCFGEEI